MTDDDTGYSTTTEDEHSHFCALCGGIWKHADEFCEGERYHPYYGDFDCPACISPE